MERIQQNKLAASGGNIPYVCCVFAKFIRNTASDTILPYPIFACF